MNDTSLVDITQLNFTQPDPARGLYNTHIKLSGNIKLSISYGDSAYGAGPEADQYEVAIIDSHTNEFIHMPGEDDDVMGWRSAQHINKLISKLISPII